MGQETRWFGRKRRADRWSIELTTNRFVSFQFDTFLFNLHWIRIGCFILEHIVCNAILWCPMGLRVTQVCRTQHVLAAHAYCLQLLRKYICWKCWDVFMDEITSYVLLKLLPTSTYLQNLKTSAKTCRWQNCDDVRWRDIFWAQCWYWHLILGSKILGARFQSGDFICVPCLQRCQFMRHNFVDAYWFVIIFD